MSLYVLAFLLAWAWNVGGYIVYKIYHDQPDWLLVVTAATINLQGLFDLVVYGIMNQQMRQLFSLWEGVLVFVIAPLWLFVAVGQFLIAKYERHLENRA